MCYNKYVMKIVLDVKCEKKLQQNDVIRYNIDKKCFEVVSFSCFNDDLYIERNKLKQEIADLRQEISDLKEGVNSKLKSYHDILSVLVKEN